MLLSDVDPDWFWPRVDRSAGPDGCWPWTGPVNEHGYGSTSVGSRTDGSRRMAKAHRIAWALTYGDPGDLDVLHTCDNPPCCNPACLFLGTQADNLKDMRQKGRGNVGERHGHSTLTTSQVLRMRWYARRGIKYATIAK